MRLLGLIRADVVRDSPPRSLPRCLLLAAAIAVAAVLLAHPVTFGPTPPLYDNDKHRFSSIEMAVTWSVCGRYGHVHRDRLVRDFLPSDGYRSPVPLVDLPRRLAGSAPAYCASLLPARNGDNSLMLTTRALLVAWPGLTMEQLGHVMRWLRVMCLGFVVFVMLRIGSSVLLALATLYGGLIVVSAVEGNRFHSMYPWFGPLLLTFAALLVLALDLGVHRRPWAAASSALAMGWLTAFVGQWRSSYLPILIGCLLVSALLGWRDARSEGRARAGGLGRHALATLVLVAIGFVAFHRTFITPLDAVPVAPETGPDVTRHDLALPLVLGLALPENDLARREGIVWLDAAGHAIARRIDPSAARYSAAEERALFRYYRRLWADHPAELLWLYLRKWSIAGTDVATYRTPPLDTRFFRWTLAPLRLVPSGIVLSLVFVLVVAVAFIRVGRWRLGACAGLALYGVSGVLLVSETALILTHFYISHESAQLLVLFLLSLLAYQAVINTALRCLRAGRSSRAPATSSTEGEDIHGRHRSQVHDPQR